MDRVEVRTFRCGHVRDSFNTRGGAKTEAAGPVTVHRRDLDTAGFARKASRPMKSMGILERHSIDPATGEVRRKATVSA